MSDSLSDDPAAADEIEVIADDLDLVQQVTTRLTSRAAP
jgi:hypothetical protein